MGLTRFRTAYIGGYNGKNCHVRRRAIQVLVGRLRRIEFDTIVCRGMSGMLVGPAVAYELDKELALLRKTDESSHCGYPVVGPLRIGKFVIIDDFVSLGFTMRKCIEEIQKHDSLAEFVGISMYRVRSRESRKAAGLDKFRYATDEGEKSAWIIDSESIRKRTAGVVEVKSAELPPERQSAVVPSITFKVDYRPGELESMQKFQGLLKVDRGSAETVPSVEEAVLW